MKSINLNNIKGADGKSAYQVAVDNGYTGTEKEWLVTLKGDTGLTGPQGPQGLKGEVGQAGVKGEKGDKGDPYVLTDPDKTAIAALVPVPTKTSELTNDSTFITQAQLTEAVQALQAQIDALKPAP